tara:strand:+ start:141 stop:1223 length:1083 start_codon:yes stop_codon:yes gene_type:complete
MKWIGQHIWDFISRFRSDVYLEDIDSGSIIGGGNLGLDSSNKIVKDNGASAVRDLHGAGVDGDANQLLTDDGDGTVTSEQKFTWDGATCGWGSTTADKPALEITCLATSGTGPSIDFKMRDGSNAGSTGDYAGTINFEAENDANELTSFAQIYARAGSVVDTDESGTFYITTATSDGSTSVRRQLITGTGHATSSIVDVDIAYGATSTTTIAGKAIVPSRKYAHPGTDDGDYTAGDIWYYDSGTATTTIGMVYYLTDAGSWIKARANATSTSTGLLAVALGNNPDVDGMLLRGFVTTYQTVGTNDHGIPVYLDDGVAGLVNVAAPGSGNVVRILGYSIGDGSTNTDAIYFNPDNTWVERS